STFPVPAGSLGAWRSGRLVYVDARLMDVIADVNRYYDGRIELDAPQVGDLRLTVAFRTDQIDRMLDMLTRALPIQVEHVGARQIRLSMRSG
ncbi:MAG TPA: FecR domain-containing protein, partial [Povalibacter sp.]|nr:FecR domain-containing protein [Povalibacter sp.]